jgi:hypothetical protein
MPEKNAIVRGPQTFARVAVAIVASCVLIATSPARPAALGPKGDPLGVNARTHDGGRATIRVYLDAEAVDHTDASRLRVIASPIEGADAEGRPQPTGTLRTKDASATFAAGTATLVDWHTQCRKGQPCTVEFEVSIDRDVRLRVQPEVIAHPDHGIFFSSPRLFPRGATLRVEVR